MDANNGFFLRFDETVKDIESYIERYLWNDFDWQAGTEPEKRVGNEDNSFPIPTFLSGGKKDHQGDPDTVETPDEPEKDKALQHWACIEISEIDDELDLVHESFRETLLRTIDSKGLNDSAVYNKAQVTRQVFNRIRNDPAYHPGKPIVFALICALELPLEDAYGLLAKLGYTFSFSSKFDIIVRYCITHGIYDIQEINAYLYHFDQPLLGSKM